MAAREPAGSDCLPVLHEGQVVGVLNVASHTEDEIEPAARDAVDVIVAQLGAVLTRVRADTALRESEQRFRLLIQRVPVVFYISALDEVGTTIYLSPQIEALLGYTPQEWIADPDLWQRCLHPSDRDRVLAEFEHMRNTGQPMQCEYRTVARDGH